MKTTQTAAKEGIYVDCAVLRSADILLTTDASLVSAAIRGATGGPYSHAALILGPTARVESDDDGVGHTTMAYARVEQLINCRDSWSLWQLLKL